MPLSSEYKKFAVLNPLKDLKWFENSSIVICGGMLCIINLADISK